MVILLRGPSCTGKTLMAQKILEKYKMPYLSIDHLKMGLIRANINCGFTQYDSDRLIAEKLWPIIKGIENNLTYFEINRDYEEEIQRVYEFIDNGMKLL